MSIAGEFKKNHSINNVDELKFEFKFFTENPGSTKKTKKSKKNKKKNIQNKTKNDVVIDEKPEEEEVTREDIVSETQVSETVAAIVDICVGDKLVVPLCTDVLLMTSLELQKPLENQLYEDPSKLEIDDADAIMPTAIGPTASNKKTKKKKNKKEKSIAVDCKAVGNNKQVEIFNEEQKLIITSNTVSNSGTHQLTKSFQKLKISKSVPDMSRNESLENKRTVTLKVPCKGGYNSNFSSLRFVSTKDPELTDEERRNRKFGNGINLSIIGPQKRVSGKWVG